jgi:hypothetical protein
MQLENSSVLILGGAGLVGGAIAKKLMAKSLKKLIISSLKKEEADQAVRDLKEEFTGLETEIVPTWGNIFTREDWKDENYGNLLSNPEKRRLVIRDTFGDLDSTVKHKSALYKLIMAHKPDLIIDCINTATGIAYRDIYSSSIGVLNDLDNGNLDTEAVESLMASTYIPQLIRHIQLLGESLNDGKAKMYFKVGTAGTGGMGLNIPYTHSEDKPSRVLMSKTAVAGAHSLLMFLMARTPGGAIVKEIKPTATIAWKKIAYGEIEKGGKAVELSDMSPDVARKMDGVLDGSDLSGVTLTGKNLESVYIDTGENGIFSKSEFETITSLGQMEIITPEEIADYLIFEAEGGNTGKDVLAGLDASTLGPSYRGGFLRESAVRQLSDLEREHENEGVAYELLGPPRLSKLLYEANILKNICGDFDSVINSSGDELRNKAVEFIKSNDGLRQKILSIGLPILLSDNEYLRGAMMKVPKMNDWTNLSFNEQNINKWCSEGWIDLRQENFDLWISRFKKIKSETEENKFDLTGSRFNRSSSYWNDYKKIEEGKIAAWIFESEEGGFRFKR